MGNFLTSSSIGRKLVMSITGAFLVLFITFHLAMNITVVFSPEAYNAICAFLGANWYALAGTLVLAAGVVIHFIYAIILTLQNLKARGNIRYARTVKEKGVDWASKNMFVLGLIVLCGLLLHLYNFWYNMQLVEIMGEHVNRFGYSPTDGAALISDLFASPAYVAIYLVWFAALWFHLTHGVWSMMQSLGLSSKVWIKRLKILSNIVATLLMLGFAFIVIVMFLRANGWLCATCG